MREPESMACRAAVRATLAQLPELAEPAQPSEPFRPQLAPPRPAPGAVVLAAVSGGADSLALAAALAWVAAREGYRGGAVCVDHGLQADSAAVAARAAELCRGLGLDPVEVVRVVVPDPCPDGPEAAARTARYAALSAAAQRHDASAVLLGHTRDDQAEQVLLALLRGSGLRSLSGMPAHRPPFSRPFLHVTRAQTQASCAELGLTPWHDPHNSDPTYTRVRVRRAVVDLERDLGPGVAAALARTAEQARADAQVLDELAARLVTDLGPGPYAVAHLSAHPAALRTRVWRRLLVAAGAPAGQVSSRHTSACDRLLTHWRGQGPVAAPGGVAIARRGGRIHVVAGHTVN